MSQRPKQRRGRRRHHQQSGRTASSSSSSSSSSSASSSSSSTSSSASSLQASIFDRTCPFSSLGLDTRLFKAAARLKFVYATVVQAKSIPSALKGRDVLVRACTGSGKTLAYILPVLQHLLQEAYRTGEEDDESRAETKSNSGHSNEFLHGQATKALILVPTRELCDQVEEQFKKLMYYCDDILSILALSDRLPVAAQIARLKEGPSIIVSTPTRLVDYIENSILSLKYSLKILVIDEADLVLSYGYEEDIKSIVDCLPKHHQSMLMSATLTPGVQSLQGLVLNRPKIIKDLADADTSQTNQLLEQYVRCTLKDKFLVTYVFLTLGVIKPKTLIFVNSVDRSFRLKLFLEQFSIPSAVLNSELPYNSRHSILQQFNRGIFDILIATDACLEQDINISQDDSVEYDESSNNTAAAVINSDTQNKKIDKHSDVQASDDDNSDDSGSDSSEGTKNMSNTSEVATSSCPSSTTSSSTSSSSVAITKGTHKRMTKKTLTSVSYRVYASPFPKVPFVCVCVCVCMCV